MLENVDTDDTSQLDKLRFTNEEQLLNVLTNFFADEVIKLDKLRLSSEVQLVNISLNSAPDKYLLFKQQIYFSYCLG